MKKTILSLVSLLFVTSTLSAVSWAEIKGDKTGWETTKDKSKEFWDEIKDESSATWETTKEKSKEAWEEVKEAAKDDEEKH